MDWDGDVHRFDSFNDPRVIDRLLLGGTFTPETRLELDQYVRTLRASIGLDTSEGAD